MVVKIAKSNVFAIIYFLELCSSYPLRCGQERPARDQKWPLFARNTKNRVLKHLELTSTLDFTTTIMLEDTVFDPTNKGTFRLNAKPIRKKGDSFKPIQLLK
jgi:hypothetical protein